MSHVHILDASASHPGRYPPQHIVTMHDNPEWWWRRRRRWHCPNAELSPHGKRLKGPDPDVARQPLGCPCCVYHVGVR